MGATSKSIIVIDDDYVIREIVKRSVANYLDGACRIFTSANGIEGLGLISVQKPDLIILDSTLPKYAGMEVLAYLEQNTNVAHNQIPVILVHEDEHLPKINYSNVIVLNKRDKDFLFKLEKAVAQKLNQNISQKKSLFPSYKNLFARKSISTSNASDILMHRILNSNLIVKILNYIIWFFNEIVLSVYLTLYYIFSGGRIKDENSIQRTRDTKAFRVRYYPTLTGILVATFIGLIQVSAFVLTGVVILNTQLRLLMAQQVCPLPAAPTVIMNQIVVVPDNIDGVIDCGSLDIIVGSTGEIVFDKYITANGSTAGDYGVTLWVNNLTVQNGGKITADGKGYSVVEAESATGKGGNSSGQTGGAGGGHGGAGGQGVEDGVNASGNGGLAYGTSENPSTFGSAGGSGGATSNAFSRDWNSDSEFNEGGSNFSSGLANPTTNNKLALKNSTNAITDGLEGYWNFDETSGTTVTDSVSGNNGSTSNITSTSGIKNQSKTISSSADKVVVGTGAYLHNNTDFTVAIWANESSNSTDFSGIISTDDTGTNTDNAWRIVRDGAGIDHYSLHWNSTIIDYPAISLNEWHQYAFTRSATSLKLYLDGVFVSDNTISDSPSTSNVLGFGTYRAGDNNYFFTGAIDEARIYNRSLEDTEITTQFNSDSGTFTTGEQTWTSGTIDQSSLDGVKISSITADWSLDSTDNINPKFQILGSNSTSFAGEETIFPESGQYYQDGGTYDINDNSALDLSGQISTYFKYIRIKVIIDTGANASDTPTVDSITINGNSSQAGSAQGGAGGGSIKILATGNLALDGTISANGLDGTSSGNTSGGGGAGGSLWIEAASFSGNGSVQAKGGNAANVTFQGGGGGGGRIMMFCNTANTFSGTSSVSGGITALSQDGGVGTTLGPTCRPNNPSILKQFKANQTVEIPVNGVTPETTVTFMSDMSDVDSGETLALQIEVKPVVNSFTGVADYTQSPNGANPQVCINPPAGCGKIVVNNLNRSTEYHWRARVRDSKGGISQWVEFGGNATAARDFVVAGIPTALNIEEGNTQSGTVYTVLGTALKVKVTDASNIPVPGVQINWGVANSSNGGSITTSTIVSTDDNGFAQVSYKLGKSPGSNIVIATVPGYGITNTTFTETGVVDELSRFKIVAPSVAIVSEDFDNVTITAYDQYDNIKTDFAGTVGISAVEALNTSNAGSGNISPATVVFDGSENGVKSFSNFNYDTQQSIRIKATNGSVINYSNVIAVVTSLGSCPDVDGIIDSNETWTATAENLGVFDCRGLVITVTSNAQLTLESYNSGDTDYTNDYETEIWADGLTIDSGSSVTANGKGYPAETGPGGGGGASYGGMGPGGQNPYGSVYEPTKLGSGGTYDNFGGGGIKLLISGLTDINGSLTANGSTNAGCHRSGGTGGSIWIDTDSINGTGLISTNGGNGQCAGSGAAGGRIAVYYNTNNGMNFTDRSKIQSFGGVGDWAGNAAAGGAGTIYVENKSNDNHHQGTLYVDNNNVATNWAGVVEDNYQFTEINLTRNGNVKFYGSNGSLTVNSGDELTGDSTRPSLIVDGTFNGPTNLDLNGVTLNIKGEINLGGNNATASINVGENVNGGLTLNANTWAHTNGDYIFDTITSNVHGVVTLNSFDNSDVNYTNDFGVNLNLQNLNILNGGNVNANYSGYAAGTGPGGGGGAPSYGGYGATGALPYGSIYTPLDLGTAGNGTAGGGAIRLQIANTLSNNGTIEAWGQSGAGCHTHGATGGSILIDTDSIRGSGLISTNGGTGVCNAYGGSGGRIAVYYNINGDGSDNDTYNFENRNQIQSYGGMGGWSGAAAAGGPGTIYVENKSEDSNLSGRLYVDNAGVNVFRAGVTAGNYQLKEINLTRYGNVDFLGTNSVVTALTNDVLTGDNTKPLMNVFGTFFGPSELTVEGLDLGIKGDFQLANGNASSIVNIGGALAGGISLDAKTWAFETGEYNLGDVNVAGNGILTLNTFNNGDADYTNDFGILLNAANVTIANGGYVTSTGKGYAGAAGLGGGGGGSYGGYGMSGAAPYGDIYTPTLLGSAGNGGTPIGGGVVNLNISGKLENNGFITSNGTDSAGCHYYGASGGSILLRTNIIEGSGVIASNGSAGACGGGGGSGGRIAIYYTENGESGSNLYGISNSTHVQAYGGSGGWAGYGMAGGPGTVYVENVGVDSANQGSLYVDNANHNINKAALIEDNYTLKQIVLTGNGNLDLVGSKSSLNVLNSNGLSGDNTKPLFDVYGTLNLPSTISLSGVDLGVRGKLNFEGGNTNSNLTLGSTNAAGMTLYAYHGLNLARNKTVTLSSTYSGGGSTYYGAYCTDGNVTSTCHTYQEDHPWLKIDLGEQTNVSALRIWNVADSTYWNRIKDYQIEVSNTGAFTGEQTTVYSTTNNAAQRPSSITFPEVSTRYIRIVLNGTDYLSLNEVEVYGTDYEDYLQSSTYDLGTINVNSNGILTLSSFDTGDSNFTNDLALKLNAANLNIAAGGNVNSNYNGYSAGGGPGYGGGSSYGGYGYSGARPYGDVFNPTDLGSGGTGSAMGGGAMIINLTGIASIDGSITAQGQQIGSCHLSGGTGGTVNLTANIIKGSGLIAADGGAGTCGGAGASGGRIAVHYAQNGENGSNLFDFDSHSQIHAYGARGDWNGGYVASGPGTVYVENTTTDQAKKGILYVDNNNSNISRAAIPEDTYDFKQIKLTRYGNLEVLGANSQLNIPSELAIAGDNTKPLLTANGTVNMPSTITISGLTLGIKGNLNFAGGGANSNVTLGGAIAGGLNLYANNGLNLARDKNVTQSSTYSSNVGAYCTDGNVTSECITATQADAWTTVDLGSNYNIASVRLWNSVDKTFWSRINDYKIEVSNTGLFAGEQTEVYTTLANAPQRPTTLQFNPINTRFIRVTLLSPNYLSLGEIEVFGQSSPDYSNLGNYLMGNVHVTSNGELGMISYNTGDAIYTNDLKVNVTATNITIDNGGNINSDYAGYTNDQGPQGGGWANYGGTGGDYNRPSYGSMYEPVDLGSGGTGGGSTGGGALKLNVTQTLINNGQIRANAYGAGGCHQSGGTGGSVWIDSNVIQGTGLIQANGAGGICAGVAGSGGRIAVYYNQNGDESNADTIDFNSNSMVQAFGGGADWQGNAGASGPGTVYYEDKANDIHLQGSLFIDNGNRTTAGTAMNFEAKDYFFKNIYIGPQVKIKAAQDLYNVESEVNLTTGVNTEVADDMVGLWHFDETTNGTCSGVDYCDSTTNARNLTAFGSTLSAGKLGNALTLDGNSYAEIDLPTTVNLGSMTISAWVKRTANTFTSGSGEELFNFNNIATTSSVDVYTNSQLRFEWPSAFNTGYTMPLNQWQLLTITYDANAGKDTIYINGEKVTEQTRGTGYSLPINTISIGKGGLDSGTYWEGQVDELAIYSRVISPEELAANAKTVALSEFNSHRGRGPVITLTGNFYLGANSIIDGYGLGFPSDSGRGKGADGAGQSGGAGGGHGGAGGAGENDGGNPSPAGGAFYGSQRRPLTLGSGGGHAGTGAAGGAGGGAFALSARTGDVQILGTIDMRGKNGLTASPGGGGGAGGSILVEGQTCNISGDLDANGGNGGDDSFDGGGGGGGRVSVLYTAGPCDITGAVTVAQGTSSGGQTGQIGTFPSVSSIPATPTFREQYKSDGATPIPVGGFTPEQTVTLKADLTDPGATLLEPRTLASEFEVVGINEDFTTANIIRGRVVAQARDTIFAGTITGSQQSYTGGTALISEANISGLIPGNEYKWRARVVNVVDNIKGSWIEFGNNSSSQPDFTVSNTSSLDLTTGSTNVEIGQPITIAVTAKDQTNATDTTYTGTVHFNSSSLTATVPSNYVFGGSDNGTKTFTDSIVFNQAGSYTITVVDVLAPSLTDTITFIVAGTPVSTPEIPISSPVSSPVEPVTPAFCAENPNSIACLLVEISSVTTDITSATSVRICFNTNIPTVARVDYGLANDSVYTDSINDDDATYSTQHCIEILNLKVDSGYIYRIVATAQSGRSGDSTSTFVTTEGLIVNVSNEVKQCIAFDENGYAFNANYQAILNYSTESDSMCTLYYGNDSNNLVYKSESLEKVKLHQATMNLTNLDGVRDLYYRIECSVSGAISMCKSNGVIPVSKYLPYYPKQISAISSNTVPALLVALTIITALSNLLSYPSIATMGVPWLISKKRKSTWGVIYDDETKEPIPFVTVRIYTKDGTVNKQIVTGFDGKYGFLVNQGSFELEITHSEYSTEKINIQIEEAEGIAARDIALSKRGTSDTNEITDKLMNLKTTFKKNLRKINLVVIVFGLSVSILSVLTNFTALNAAILVIYGVQFALVMLIGKSPRDWGYVYETSTYQRVKGASIRVFSIEEGRQVDVQIADEEGRFGFNLKDGNYYVQVNAAGYKLADSVSSTYQTLKSPTGQTLIKTEIKKGKQINLALPLVSGQEIAGKFGM